MDFIGRYLDQVQAIAGLIDREAVHRIVDAVCALKGRGGRLFVLGVGGGAGHASHAVNDFRKIAGIEAYAPTDNVSELTARINDDGWDTAFARWLEGSRLTPRDLILVFSVGGGDASRNISRNLVRALEYAKRVGAPIAGVVGRDGGFTAQVGDAVVTIPVVDAETVTPHTEAFQAVVWHLVVSHPRVRACEEKWESVR
jgi:D-sedoheptulose 7-phosphate isomerase